MERGVNARGHAGSIACPLKSPIPQRRAKSARREVLMNNLNEHPPFPNNLQASSKDPLGFIYSTYWAAKTEVEG
jgi:hypothetical protein